MIVSIIYLYKQRMFFFYKLAANISFVKKKTVIYPDESAKKKCRMSLNNYNILEISSMSIINQRCIYCDSKFNLQITMNMHHGRTFGARTIIKFTLNLIILNVIAQFEEYQRFFFL